MSFNPEDVLFAPVAVRCATSLEAPRKILVPTVLRQKQHLNAHFAIWSQDQSPPDCGFFGRAYAVLEGSGHRRRTGQKKDSMDGPPPELNRAAFSQLQPNESVCDCIVCDSSLRLKEQECQRL